MITATYYAADQDTFSIEISENDIFGEYADTNELSKNVSVINYASFFGNGIDMFDNSVVFADSTDYLGLIGNINEALLLPVSDEDKTLENGLTVVFDKFSCQKIEVLYYHGQDEKLIATVEDESFLPLITPISFEQEVHSLGSIIIRFSGFPEKAYMTIRGIILGRIINIDKFLSFDSVSEIRPLGDDLPLNEINSDVLLEEKFFSSEGQRIVYYDNGIMEDGVVISADTTNEKKYFFKSQNIISRLNDDTLDYNSYQGEYSGWLNKKVYAADEIEKIKQKTRFSDISYPDFFEEYELSKFLPPKSGRQVLQQIAWATCCAIDTSYRDKLVFVPFLVSDSSVPDIKISNEDKRILKTAINRGEKFSKIIWEYKEYTRSEELETIADVTPILYSSSGDVSEYYIDFSTSEPFDLYDFSVANWEVLYCSPYSISGSASYGTVHKATGYRYKAQKAKTEIDIGFNSKKTLTITNQTLHPVDKTKKIEQIRRWYSMNNTLSATVVDNGDIRLGKILQIQLENGNYFTGIITKIERSNVSDYHVVRLEAHEWH